MIVGKLRVDRRIGHALYSPRQQNQTQSAQYGYIIGQWQGFTCLVDTLHSKAILSLIHVFPFYSNPINYCEYPQKRNHPEQSAGQMVAIGKKR